MPENWWESDPAAEGDWWSADTAEEPKYTQPPERKPLPAWPKQEEKSIWRRALEEAPNTPGADILKGAAKSLGRLAAGAEAYAPGNLLMSAAKGAKRLVTGDQESGLSLSDLVSGKKAEQESIAPWVRARENQRKIEKALGLSQGDLEAKNAYQTAGGIAPYLFAPQGAAGTLGGLGLNALISGGGTLLEGADPTAAGVAGAAGALIPAGINKALKPFAGKVATQTVEAAKRLGLELPASALTNSPTAQMLESAGAKMIGGGKIAGRAQKAAEGLQTIASELSSGGRSAALADTGEQMAGGLKNYVSGWRAAKNAAYEKANLKGVAVTPQATLEKIDSLLAEGSLEPGALAYLKKIRTAIAPLPVEEAGGGLAQSIDPMTGLLKGWSFSKPRDATKILSSIRELQSRGQSYLSEPWAAKNKALFRSLAESLAGDLDEGVRATNPKLLQDYQAAKDIYMSGAKVRESDWAKSITRLAAKGETDKIAAAVFKPSMSAQNIPKVFETLGPEAADGIRQATQAKLVEQATAGGNFTPQSLTRAINRFGKDKVAAILTPEQMQKLTDVAEVTQGLGKATRITGGSQTAYLANIMAMLGSAPFDPMAPLKIAGTQTAFAKSLGSNLGQRWLTRGLGGPTSGVLAGRAGGLGIGDEIEALRRQRELPESLR